MSQELLQNIYAKITHDPLFGIAIKNNSDGRWIKTFTTYAQMQKQGFNTVDACFSAIEAQGFKDITVYLKRKCGTSSVYVDGKEVRLIVPEDTGRDSSTNTKEVFAGNSANASVLVENAIKHPPVMHNQSKGLLGGMNDLQVVDMYSKSNQYDTQKTELQRITAELIQVKSEVERLKFENFKLESKLEAKNSEKKTLVSDEIASMFLNVAPSIAQQFAKTPVGLNAPSAPVESFSELKTNLLNFVKNEGVTDDYCQLLYAVLNNALVNEKVVVQLQELAQPLD